METKKPLGSWKELTRALFGAMDGYWGIPTAEKLRVLPFLKSLTLAKGEFFVRSSDLVQRLGFVANGLLRHFSVSGTGDEFTLSFLQEGRFAGIQCSRYFEVPSCYRIQCLEASRLLVIDFEDWVSLSRASLFWSQFQHRVMESETLRAARRERSLMLVDAAARYRDLLDEIPSAEKRIQQRLLASYLGVTPRFLSKIRQKTAKE